MEIAPGIYEIGAKRGGYFKAWHTPGHLTFYWPERKALFTTYVFGIYTIIRLVIG